MIIVGPEDVGRRVIYVEGLYPKAPREEGRITSFNDDYVFVRYGNDTTSAATAREALYWPGEEP